MPAPSGISWVLPLLIVGLVLQATPALAFGAGNIPSYAYLEGKAFRHGDIEDVLAELARGSGGGLLGAMTGGLLAKKWSGLDIKRCYFGNWLRDYSQAMDVAGLSKLSEQAILNLVMVLGFLAHGYATGEFEVTASRLGVYLPVEHLDNPYMYNDNKDARQVHPKLRPPVDPQELEVDPRTGMLNFLANENGHWDTSKACVRRTLLACIDMGRRAKHGGGGSEALYEAYRLLGTALHTLEDFSAHSNYCELALQKLGYHQIYDHVGSNVRVRAPNGQMVAPLVTGSFGGADFLHSLLGEAGDHISSASVSDLNKQMEKARSQSTDRGFNDLRNLFSQLPGEGGGLSRDLDNATRATNTGKNPSDMSPQELHAVLWQVLTFRDNVSKFIEQTIEKIPGLGSLIEKIGDNLATFVFVTLEPFIKPIMQQATGVLQQGSSQVISSQDQYRVFNDPNFPHPTHSILAKDHFSGILNEPAGNIAKLIVRHVVKDVVEAWDNPGNDPHQHIESILACLYHPAFNTGASIQNEMEAYMRSWIDSEDKNYTLNALTKESIRNGKNHRKGHATEKPTVGPGGYTSFLPTPQKLESQASNFVQQQLHQVPGYNQLQSGYNQFHNVFPGSGGARREIGPGDYDQASYGQPGAPPVGGAYGAPSSHSPYPVHQDPYGSQAPPQPYQSGPDYGQHYQPGPPPQQQHFGGPPPQPSFGYGPPPGQEMYGGPPPPPSHQQPYYGQHDPKAYPGAQYQQHHSGPPPQSGAYGAGSWSGQPPPSGRW